mmetsp:Transcript_25267/g.70683  ORF Transcript_25267/g.70683 Transcript_25267/m.70683 type:complete len:332 (-) Transcript_25267:272-1267(-)
MAVSTRIIAAITLVTVLAAGVTFIHRWEPAEQVEAFSQSDLSSFYKRMADVKGKNGLGSQDTLWGSAVDAERRELIGGNPYYTPTPTPTAAPEFLGGPWMEVVDPEAGSLEGNLFKFSFNEATGEYTLCQQARVQPVEPTAGDKDLSLGKGFDTEFAEDGTDDDTVYKVNVETNPKGNPSPFVRLGGIPFGFNTYTNFWVGTNGFLAFEEPTFKKTTSLNNFADTPMIAALFTRLTTNQQTNTKLKIRVRHQTRVISIVWNRLGEYGSAQFGDRKTMTQLVIDGPSGDIWFQYYDVRINNLAYIGLSAGEGRDVMKDVVGETDFTAASTCA